MNYLRLTNKSLTFAFKKLQSLAVDVTLNKRTAMDFNFGTDTVTSTDVSIPTKAIIISKIKKSSKSNTITQQLILLTQNVGDLSIYDTILLDGIIWNLGLPIIDNGFVTLIDILREA